MPLTAAQDQATQSPAGQSTSQQDTGDENAAGADAAESDPELPDIDSQPIEPAEGSGPGRFIPSEQISQDLGVSFPVDI